MNSCKLNTIILLLAMSFPYNQATGECGKKVSFQRCDAPNITTCEKNNCCVFKYKNETTNEPIEICRMKRESVKNGSCTLYKTSEPNPVCPDFINTTRFFDRRYGINKTMEITKVFHRNIEIVLKSSETCKKMITKASCALVIPKCISDNVTEEHPCREDCEYLFNTCREQFQNVIGALIIKIQQVNIDFVHTELPNSCDSFKYSYELPPNITCGMIFGDMVDRNPPLNKKKQPDKLIIAVASGVGAAVLLVVIVVFTVFRQRKMKRELLEKENEPGQNMSIREHLKCSTLSDPLEELLANAKPGELVQYPLDCVEYVKELGEGQFGKVFQGRVHGVVKDEESTDVAVKCLKEGSSEVAKTLFNQEVKLMSVLQHDNILRLLAISTNEEPYCMIFEFMENGDLNEFLRRWNGKEYLNDSQLIKICKNIACGMEYLASKKFLHRDLATRNCLVGKNHMIKIADFGMSRNVYHSDYYRVGGEAMLPIRWMPPESILYGKFTIASDVYSFGVVLWEVFSFAVQPFYGHTNEEVIDFIKKGVLLPQPEDCPEWIYNIMLSCWKSDPDERITFTKALQLLKGRMDSKKPAKANKKTTKEARGSFNTVPVKKPLSDYDAVIVDQSSQGYDKVTSNQNSSEYEKIWSKEKTNGDHSYINLKPEKKEGETSSQSEPSSPTTPGTSNMAFDDDESKLLKPSSAGGSSSNRGRSLTPRNSRKSKEDMNPRASSTELNPNKMQLRSSGISGRSIKDVMREGPRYISSGSLPRKSYEVNQRDEDEEEDSGYISSIRPTSEFFPFHGYGESIKASDPEEAKIIKRIIEDKIFGSHMRWSARKRKINANDLTLTIPKSIARNTPS